MRTIEFEIKQVIQKSNRIKPFLDIRLAQFVIYLLVSDEDIAKDLTAIYSWKLDLIDGDQITTVVSGTSARGKNPKRAVDTEHCSHVLNKPFGFHLIAIFSTKSLKIGLQDKKNKVELQINSISSPQ